MKSYKDYEEMQLRAFFALSNFYAIAWLLLFTLDSLTVLSHGSSYKGGLFTQNTLQEIKLQTVAYS